ncbi:MAG: hypothetical protein HY438_03425 [DPANN group archaeon]|nr:hypothetical protein [DPANN group archaeon]
MELKILSKHENKLLNRIEIEASVSFANEITPKRKDMKKLLAAQLGADESLLIIKKFSATLGTNAKLFANLYKSKEEMQKREPKYVVGRETGQKKKPVGKAKK